MPKSEPKKTVGVNESTYREIEEFGDNHKPKLFFFEVIDMAWEALKEKEKNEPNFN